MFFGVRKTIVLVMVKIQTYDFSPEIAFYGLDRMLVRVLPLQAGEGEF
jgi:hypothetical protein